MKLSQTPEVPSHTSSRNVSFEVPMKLIQTPEVPRISKNISRKFLEFLTFGSNETA